jgi:hypothetical protein
MPKANEVATELRKLADALDKSPDVKLIRPFIFFTHYGESEKESFLAVAKALPRPFTKEYKDNDVRLEYESRGVNIFVKINQSAICRLVTPARPAEYECEPLLSLEEEESLA